MAKNPSGGRRLPPARAFVVQFPEGDLGDRPSCGRVEHVKTGRSLRFNDVDRLVEFFAEVLRAEQAKSDDEDKY